MKQVGRRQRTTGLPGRSCPWAAALSVLLLAGPGLSAPQVSGSERTDAFDGSQPFTMINPFGAGEEVNSLRQSYIKGNLKEGQMSPVLNTWEQEVFFLFSLHDYDKSGQMDGLEMMKLLSDFLSHNSVGPQSADSVVSMVDSLLQTQDLNQDGMLDPSELLSLPTEPQNPKQQAGGGEASEPTSDGADAHDSKQQRQGDSVPGQETRERQEAPQQLSQQGQEVQGEQDGGEREMDADKREVHERAEEAGEVHDQQSEERQGEESQDQAREGVPAHQGQPEI